MGNPYADDIVAWADTQAALLRAGRVAAIDVEHIADEIEAVGKGEKHALASHFSVLLAHLLKWQLQPQRRGKSWARSIKEQRRVVRLYLRGAPSLRAVLADADWLELVWAHAVARAARKTGLHDFPDDNPWPVEQIMHDDFWPD